MRQEGSTRILRDFDESIDKVAERVCPAVVKILVSGLGASSQESDGVIERQRGIGSGVIVDPDGYVITNAHVVLNAQRVRVLLSPIGAELVPEKTSFLSRQRTFEAKLIGIHRLTDLALLKIEEKNLPYIPLKQAFSVRLGQTVLAIGSPVGLDHTVTMGIVSAPGRQLEADNPMIYVQTDAPINPGNSGGALVDRDGNLVGINTFVYSKGGGSEGLGFAIPEPTVRFVYEELKQHGRVRVNVIGANAQTITPLLAAGLKLPRDWGVVISDVLPGSPAERAGVLTRDIVTEIDDVGIDSLPRFTARLYLHPHNRSITMTVQRGSEQLKLSIEPMDAPAGIESLSELINPHDSLVSQLGLFVIDMDKALANNWPQTRSSTGVIVVGKVDYVPTIETELAVGDVIHKINGLPVSNTDGLRTELLRLKAGDAVVMQVERQGMYQFIPFEME
ncbi:MAG TPA: trypsin-like peptidase domain-containing protein [Terriglobia bacterium]|nr:trypsin-like peptidase domain-containing protein [Terriglobia bacterium]